MTKYYSVSMAEVKVQVRQKQAKAKRTDPKWIGSAQAKTRRAEAKQVKTQRVKTRRAKSQDELENQLVRQSQLADELGMPMKELSFMSVRALDHVFSLRGTEWRRQLTIAYRKEMISILAGQLVSG